VADFEKTCANCGHTQATGDFCEACGTRLPATRPVQPVAGAAAVHGVTPPPPTPTTPTAETASPSYGAQAQYGTPPPLQPPPAPAHYPHPRGRSFWSRLFDLSFEEFITPSIIKVLFIIAMVVIGLGVLAIIVMGFMASGALGIFTLIGALIGGFLYVLFARVMLEMIVVFFRIRDNTDEIAKSKH